MIATTDAASVATLIMRSSLNFMASLPAFMVDEPIGLVQMTEVQVTEVTSCGRYLAPVSAVSSPAAHSPVADSPAPSTPSSPDPQKIRSWSFSPRDTARAAWDSQPALHRSPFPGRTYPKIAAAFPLLHTPQKNLARVQNKGRRDPSASSPKSSPIPPDPPTPPRLPSKSENAQCRVPWRSAVPSVRPAPGSQPASDSSPPWPPTRTDRPVLLKKSAPAHRSR